jgi:hypothetical protein
MMPVSPEDQDRFIATLWRVDPNANDLHGQVLEALRIEFERTPNPMLPWSVLRWVKARGAAIPEWVINYFYDKAVVLTAIVAEDAKKEAREVARALGFGAGGKGARSAGAKLVPLWRDLDIAIHTAELIAQGVAPENAITETAKALKKSSSTVRRAHAAYFDRAASFW